MKDLVKHIEILLLDNDCVIVPGFGGFMAHHVDALYLDEENTWIPPRRTLGFNPQLHINDSLLVQSYVEAYDISYPEALKAIEDDVRELKQILHNKGSFEFNDIGVISINVDGNYIFEPCLSGILTPELYALNSFEMTKLHSSGINQNISGENSIEKQPSVVHNITAKHKKDIKNDNADIKQTEEQEDNNQRTKIISLDIVRLRNVAAIAILFVLFVFSSLPTGDSSKHGQSQCSIDTNILTSFMPQAQVLNDNELQPIKVVNNTVMLTGKKQEEKTEESSISKESEIAKDSFTIVLASKISKKNAENYVASLKQNGIKEAEIYNSKSGNKVICGKFASEAEAYSAIKTLHSKENAFEDAWIMKIN